METIEFFKKNYKFTIIVTLVSLLLLHLLVRKEIRDENFEKAIQHYETLLRFNPELNDEIQLKIKEIRELQ